MYDGIYEEAFNDELEKIAYGGGPKEKLEWLKKRVKRQEKESKKWPKGSFFRKISDRKLKNFTKLRDKKQSKVDQMEF